MNEVPSYLRSETLRLIQEDEARKEMAREASHHSVAAPTTQQGGLFNDFTIQYGFIFFM